MFDVAKRFAFGEEHRRKFVSPENAADLRKREEWNEGYDEY